MTWSQDSFCVALDLFRVLGYAPRVGKILSYFQRAPFLGLLIAANLAVAQDIKPKVAPPSKWVVPVPVNGHFDTEAADPSISSRWLLMDRQINAQYEEDFTHRVRQVLTPDGVQRDSHIVIEYDPSYQSLTMHWVKLWRGTNQLDRLGSAQSQTSQQGLDTEDYLFTSDQYTTLVLDDIRPGDIIDYAYTIAGNNPAFDGKFVSEVPLQYSQPVDRLMTRLLWQSPRKLYVQNHGTDLVPVTIHKGTTVEFKWDCAKVPGLRLQPPTPVWYNPHPWVELSEFQKWSDVNKWALNLFTTTNAISRDLLAKINEWSRLPAPEDRLLAALQFVQEQVRYLGVESGASDFEPATPSVVFARRYGDCKDKTWLLVTILRALKIEAYPLLVNTSMRQTVADMHASAVLFDHAITQVILNGQRYFLDATATYQRGPLADRSWRNYSYGLLIRPGTAALAEIPTCPVQPKTMVSSYFTIRGLNSDSDLKIVTDAEGRDADELRAEFATTARDDIERERLEQAARDYPQIRATDHLQFNDDQQNNRVEITEFYAITGIWKRPRGETYYRCEFYPRNVAEAMRKPAVSFRTQPLGMDYPSHQISHIEASLSFVPTYPIAPDTQNIENPAFYFHRSINYTGGSVIIDYEYHSLSDVVMPEEVPTCLRQLNAGSDLLGYDISTD